MIGEHKMTVGLMAVEQKRGRGRPRLSDDVKAQRKAERDAAKGYGAANTYTEDELFDLLLECEPRVREAEHVAKQAAEGVKQERGVLAAAFGGMAVARKKLDLFRRAHTDEGEAEAHELIEMRERLKKVLSLEQAGDATGQIVEDRIVPLAPELQAGGSH